MEHKRYLKDVVVGDKIVCYIEPNAMLKSKSRLELQTVRVVTKSGRIVTDSHIFAPVKHGGWYKQYGGKGASAYAPLQPNYRFSWVYPEAETMLQAYEQNSVKVDIDELIEQIKDASQDTLFKIKCLLEGNKS